VGGAGLGAWATAIDLPTLVVVVGIFANLVPIWVPTVVGSMDGPIHMGAAADLLHFLTAPASPARAHLAPLFFPVPNLTPELAYTTLLAILPPTLAEKVFLTGYVVAFTLAFRYAILSVDRRMGWLTVFAIPLTLSVAFAFGLFNYVWSLVPFLLVTGYVLRHRADLRPRHAAVLGVLLAITYLTHLVSYVEALLAVATVVGMDALAELRARPRALGHVVRTRLPIALAVAPSVIVAAIFLIGNGAEGSDYRRALVTLVAGLPSFAWPLVTFDRKEIAFTTVLGVTLGGLTVAALLARRRAWTLRPSDSLLVATVLSTGAYLLSPEATGSGGLISERLALYPPIFLVLWLAAQELPRLAPRFAATAVAVAMTGLLVLRAPT
jgi:hypothetical protein